MKQAKGYTGARSRTLRAAKEQVMHAGADAFTHRKDKKGDFRKLWISRINAAARMHGLSYSKFIGKVKIIEGSGLKTEKIIKKENFNKVPNIIFVGRLLYEKGIREFLELVKLIKNNHKANFFVAGKPDFGNKSSINKNEFDALCNNDNVTYLGEVDVYSELHKYDILIQPSYHEGFSRVLLEGIYTGLWCMSNE